MAFNLGGRLVRSIIGIGVAVVIGVGWFAFSSLKEKATAPDVGECVTVSGSSANAEVDETDCGGDDVLFRVTGDDGKCDPVEVTYTVEVNGSDAVNLCLEWDVEVGDCVDLGTDIAKKVDCAASGVNVVRVTTVEDDATASCAKKADTPFPNEKRGTLICVAPNA